MPWEAKPHRWKALQPLELTHFVWNTKCSSHHGTHLVTPRDASRPWGLCNQWLHYALWGFASQVESSVVTWVDTFCVFTQNVHLVQSHTWLRLVTLRVPEAYGIVDCFTPWSALPPRSKAWCPLELTHFVFHTKCSSVHGAHLVSPRDASRPWGLGYCWVGLALWGFASQVKSSVII